MNEFIAARHAISTEPLLLARKRRRAEGDTL
jgi:hypothetical protein